MLCLKHVTENALFFPVNILLTCIIIVEIYLESFDFEIVNAFTISIHINWYFKTSYNGGRVNTYI